MAIIFLQKFEQKQENVCRLFAEILRSERCKGFGIPSGKKHGKTTQKLPNGKVQAMPGSQALDHRSGAECSATK